METKSSQDQKVDVNFESHPPIDGDFEGISTLLKQTLLHYVDCNSLARYLISLKDITQIIALEDSDEENTTEEDEPDNDIYGVVSVIEVKDEFNADDIESESRKQLNKFLKEKLPDYKKLCDGSSEASKNKIALIVNERYINLPPQLALPTLKNLTKHLDKSQYTHLLFICKVLHRSRNTETKLPSKKTKTGSKSQDQDAEPLIYVNPEEEIIFEGSNHFSDLDVSPFCDENAVWSPNSDIKYTPHRRFMLTEYKNWPTILSNLEKELS